MKNFTFNEEVLFFREKMHKVYTDELCDKYSLVVSKILDSNIENKEINEWELQWLNVILIYFLQKKISRKSLSFDDISSYYNFSNKRKNLLEKVIFHFNLLKKSS